VLHPVPPLLTYLVPKADDHCTKCFHAYRYFQVPRRLIDMAEEQVG
jgi:hypothetical protein